MARVRGQVAGEVNDPRSKRGGPLFSRSGLIGNETVFVGLAKVQKLVKGKGVGTLKDILSLRVSTPFPFPVIYQILGMKDGPPRFSHFILAPAKDGKPGEVTVVGWHKSVDPNRKDNFLAFLVTEYGQGGASKFPTKSQGKVGVITVTFAYSFPEGTARSGGETGFGASSVGPRGPSPSRTARSGGETGFGPPPYHKATWG